MIAIDDKVDEVYDPHFPLGTPRGAHDFVPPSKRLHPIEGRPHWFLDANGVEVYVEPPIKAP